MIIFLSSIIQPARKAISIHICMHARTHENIYAQNERMNKTKLSPQVLPTGTYEDKERNLYRK